MVRTNFSEAIQRKIHAKNGNRCVLCLNKEVNERGWYCAHLIDASEQGKTQVSNKLNLCPHQHILKMFSLQWPYILGSYHRDIAGGLWKMAHYVRSLGYTVEPIVQLIRYQNAPPAILPIYPHGTTTSCSLPHRRFFNTSSTIWRGQIQWTKNLYTR
jgi:hypothetical protein